MKKKLLEKGKGHTPKDIHQFQLLPLFNSSHFKRKTESKYKGCFDVVCKTQRRQIRKLNEHAHYVNAYFV